MCLLSLLRFLGQPDHEFGIAGLGGEADAAIVLGGDDAAGDIEPEAGSDTDGFGGVEGLENLLAMLGRDAAALVGDADADIAAFSSGADAHL